MDIRKLIARADEENFLEWLENFPTQVREAVELGRSVSDFSVDVDSLLIGGMGGSAITGDLVAQFLYDRLEIPVRTIRGYRLPASLDENTLFVGISYSGNTEETLSMFSQARRAGASCLAVTSNGELSRQVGADGGRIIEIPAGQPPRASAPYLFVPLLYWLEELGVATAPDSSTVEATLRELEELNEKLKPGGENNPALELAAELEDKINLFYGSQPLTGVLALRLKNQFNENAKMIALANEFPELNHNEIMGWKQLGENPDSYAAVFLRDESESERVQQRFEISREILEENVGEIYEISSRGESRFARFLTLMLYTDYVSYYVAVLRQENPSDIEAIETLKEKLAEA